MIKTLKKIFKKSPKTNIFGSNTNIYIGIFSRSLNYSGYPMVAMEN